MIRSGPPVRYQTIYLQRLVVDRPDSPHEAWLNWSLPSDNRWHEYRGAVLDLTNRLDNAFLLIEHDDIVPIAIHNWRPSPTNQPCPTLGQ